MIINRFNCKYYVEYFARMKRSNKIQGSTFKRE